jgi:hypothetical protein
MPAKGYKKEIDFELLDKFCGFDHSLMACSHFLKVSSDTLERRIKEKTGLTFAEYKAPFVEELRTKINAAGLDEAVNKRTPQILKMYLQKYCEFSDMVKQTNIQELSDDSNVLVEELKRLITSKK